MISYSNTSKLLFSQGQNSVMNLKAKSSQRATDTAFKSVFENTVSSNSKVTNDRSVSKRDSNASQNSESKIKYNSFREVERDTSINSKPNSVENTNNDAAIQNVDSKAEELQNNSKTNDETINVLAQMLGIQPNELEKLAKELGFSAEDLQKSDKLSLFMDKLANVLELSATQKAMMTTLAVEIPKQVGTENSKEAISNLEKTVSDGNSDKVNTVANNIKTVDLSEIAEDIKTKLDKLIQNAEISSESVPSEISKAVEVMRATKGVVSVTQADLKTDISTDIESVTEEGSEEIAGNKAKEESARADNSKSKEKSENSESSNTNAEADTKIINNQVTANNTQNQQQNEQSTQAFGDIKISAVNNQTQVYKAESSMPQPVRTSEVINQVVEQAKVIVGQDKSEMIIQLKPDHLGKLELKVVTEQGIVAAKFIAESQQVKEIIETNMQLLKDSLEKQGLSIDNVSVQVGQEKQSDNNQQNSYQSNNKNNSIKFGGSEINTDKVGYDAFDTLPETLAQYGNETNTVNFIA